MHANLRGCRAVGPISRAIYFIPLLLLIVAAPALAEDPPDATGAKYHQTKVIKPEGSDPGLSLACFCIAKDGRIIAALSRPRDEHSAIASSDESKKSAGDAELAKNSQAVGELELLDPDGKLMKSWKLDFEPQAVSTGPESTIYLAGGGVLARFDMDGKQLARAESPQVVASRKDPKELERRARVTLDDTRKQFKPIIEQFQTQFDEINKTDEKSLSDEQRASKSMLEQRLKMLKQRDEQNNKPITDKQVKDMMAQIALSDRRVNSIAAGVSYVYTTTRANKGYGFRVWRSDLDFAHPKQIASGLSGCCGQMDVQCCGDEAVVAENSRYRVVRYSSEGKKLASFGKSSRDGAAEGFNGCCNPMNTRAVGDDLYVSESNGLVKLFSKDGVYKGIVGLANVRAGCKSSIVDVSPDRKRVYYIDVINNGICVLDRDTKLTDSSK
jgi:hypothetical protein